MADNDLLQAYNLKISKRLLSCYVGIVLALIMSTLSLYATFYHDQIDPWLENITEYTQAAHKTVDETKVIPIESTADVSINLATETKLKTVQALNLLYAAEISYKILHNKEQALQIIDLVATLIPTSILAELGALQQALEIAVIIRPEQLAAALETFKAAYALEVKQGHLGQKTIAQVIKIEDQIFMQKQTQLFDKLSALQAAADSDKIEHLSDKITALITAAQNIDASLGAKAQELLRFNDDKNVVSFAKVLQALSQELGIK